MKWETFINKLGNNTTVLARVSDDVLDEEDWPVHTLIFEEGICTSQTEKQKGVYSLSASFIGKRTEDLIEWANYDASGNNPEMFHEICILEQRKQSDVQQKLMRTFVAGGGRQELTKGYTALLNRIPDDDLKEVVIYSGLPFLAGKSKQEHINYFVREIDKENMEEVMQRLNMMKDKYPQWF